MTTYIKRLENLEQRGCFKSALKRSGRKLRVIVHPDQVNDLQAQSLARSLVRKIEEDLE